MLGQSFFAELGTLGVLERCETQRASTTRIAERRIQNASEPDLRHVAPPSVPNIGTRFAKRTSGKTRE